MNCDICGKEESVGVFASQLGPVSFSKCQTCMDNNAEPEGTLRVCEILNPDSSVFNEAKAWITVYIDGKYFLHDQWQKISASRDHLFDMSFARKVAELNRIDRENYGTL